MKRRAFLIGAPLALTACGAVSVWAPQEAVNAAMTPRVGAPSLTLYTVVNKASGNGAHTAILINASQRVLFDPAGSFKSPSIPERNDVLFGMTPAYEQLFVSYHARKSFYVEGQRIAVSAAVAEQALQLALNYGAVGQGGCSKSSSAILRQLPGFESTKSTFFPNNLRDDFAKFPGVGYARYDEDDSDDKRTALQ